MSLIASASGKKFELAPAGVHMARCYRIIDLGTQRYEYKGTMKEGRKIIIYWELCGNTDAEGRPFMISKKYTLSLGENATLRKDLKAWRGRDFTPAELERFDLKNVLDKPCQLNVLRESNNGKEYANIGAIMPLGSAQVAPQLVNPPLLFSLSAFDAAAYASLSDGLKAIISQSPEYAEATGATYTAPASDAIDSDIPF